MAARFFEWNDESAAGARAPVVASRSSALRVPSIGNWVRMAMSTPGIQKIVLRHRDRGVVAEWDWFPWRDSIEGLICNIADTALQNAIDCLGFGAPGEPVYYALESVGDNVLRFGHVFRVMI